MPTIADLRAKVSIDGADKAKQDLKDLKGGSGSGGGGILDLASSFKAGLGAVSGFLAGFGAVSIATDALGFLKDQLGGIIEAGMSQQQVMAQTAAVIKSTGGEAGFSAEQIGNMADSLAQLTGISNDTIQSSENVLLTFRSIGHDVFPQAEQSILDVATAMHEDLQSATVQVGKALNDPITGMTALQRIGVTFTAGQKAVITQMEKTGNTVGAQKLILQELTKEFGNSATAAGTTLPGKLAILNEKFDEAKEKIAGAVIPVLSDLVSKYLMPVADWLGARLPGAITVLTGFLDNDLVPAINAVVTSPVVTTLEGWATAIADKVSPAFGDAGLAGHANTAKTALKNLDGQADTTGKNAAGPFVTRVQQAITKIDAYTGALGPSTDPNAGATGATKRFNDNLTKLDTNLDKAAQSTDKNKQAQQQSIPVISGIGDLFGRAGASVGQFVDSIGQRLPAAQPQISRFFDFAKQTFGGALPGLQNMWNGFWGTLGTPVQIAFDTVQSIINMGEDMLGGKWQKLYDDANIGMKKITDDIKNGLASAGRFVIGGVQALIGGWIAAIQNWPSLLAPELRKDYDQFEKAAENGWKVAMATLQSFINQHLPHIPGLDLTKIGLPGMPNRASGGPISGNFIGAEGGGMELLMTPGVYHAPPGSYVYNASQTQQMLSGGGNGGGRSNVTHITNVYPQQAQIDTAELARIQRRRELLTGMRG